MFFNFRATFAKFEIDLLRMRTREGMAVTQARGHLKGKNLSPQPPFLVYFRQGWGLLIACTHW